MSRKRWYNARCVRAAMRKKQWCKGMGRTQEAKACMDRHKKKRK